MRTGRSSIFRRGKSRSTHPHVYNQRNRHQQQVRPTLILGQSSVVTLVSEESGNMELPSSVYQSGEQDYMTWPEDVFPATNTSSETSRQDMESDVPFVGGLDYASYNECFQASDIEDFMSTWNEPPVPAMYDLNATHSVPDKTPQLFTDPAMYDFTATLPVQDEINRYVSDTS
jgi:hypothetical protein